MAKLDDMLHQVGLHALAKPRPGIESPPLEEAAAENPAGIIDTAYVRTGRPIRPFDLTGPRGRDPFGVPKIITPGLPPAVTGEFRRPVRDKRYERPARPGNFASYLNIAGAASGQLLGEDVGFPIGTIQIDNYTSVWLYVYGIERFIPPTTMAWQFPLGKKLTRIHVVASAPPTFAQPSFTAGGVFYAFCFEERLPMMAGVSA